MGAQALRSDPPLDCTCPGSSFHSDGGQYCSQNFQAASASRGNIRAGCDVPIRRVVIEKYRLFATCRYREPSGRARFPAHWKSAVRKRGSIERFVENQRPSIGPCGLVRVSGGSCVTIRTPAGSRWVGTLRQTSVTQRLTTAANSCGKVRNPAPTATNPTNPARPGSPAKCIRQDASSIPICGIEPASETSQASRTGRAIFGLRAWLEVWRLADLERIHSIAWL